MQTDAGIKKRLNYIIQISLIFTVVFAGPDSRWLSAGPLYASETAGPLLSCRNKAETEFKDYRVAWMYFFLDEIKETSKIMAKYNPSGRRCNDWWLVLEGSVYLQQNKYGEALDIIGRARPGVEKSYGSLNGKSTALTPEEKHDVEFVYFNMIYTSAWANYHLKNLDAAIEDFTLLAQKDADNKTAYSMAADCCYRKKQYDRALDYYKKSFARLQEGEKKDAASYGIARMNALTGNVEEAISALKLPLEHNKSKWLREIDAGEDFNPVRSDKRFIVFLNQYKDRK